MATKPSPRDDTSGILADIDSIIEDVRFSSAKLAFDNLLSLHEGEEAIGNFYVTHGRTPGAWDAKEDLQDLDDEIIFRSGRQRFFVCMDDECECRFTDTRTFFEFAPVICTRKPKMNKNDLEALAYSREFFGSDDLLFLENNYGYDAIPLSESDALDQLDLWEAENKALGLLT